MNEHTVKVFDDELGQLRGLIAQMGGLAEAAIEGAIQALVRHDLEAAAEVVQGDKRIDALESEVERLAVQLIALRAPMADDLREVVAGMKIANVLERVGDHAKNIAKRVVEVEQANHIEPLSVLPAMATVASDMLHDVLDAFAARDAELAASIGERDRAVDDFYNSLFRALVTFMMENPKSITQATHLLFIAKNLERIGDQATNLAEMVYYAATGEQLGERDRMDTISGK
ncbi:phosphate signaling complex protein PhoU [Sphingomonas baiyangensis]|uniref:Phosphate-specific transport system accessory protein PhoU n=1 Tax=Sphingomonas baiyangensis TaxID=2572576 RepID=A0A4V6WRF2_9SPHN|nr:phosphate signaling complex protein PhoU [Sphingomonas baiyangensis]TKD50628.1 phosphate signaling complex protein PhoU [Sphingomonas baiyangensis]